MTTAITDDDTRKLRELRERETREANDARMRSEAVTLGGQVAALRCFNRAVRRGDWEQAIDVATAALSGAWPCTAQQLVRWRLRKQRCARAAGA